jgi:hypothetical protein
MKQGSSNGASPSEGIHESNLEGGLLYWGPQKIC